MKRFWWVGVFAAGVALGWILHQPDELPDMMGDAQLVRMPGGEPDAPAPNGGKFRVVSVTEDGARQRFREPRESAQWGLSLAGGRVYLHLVRLPE